IWNTETGNLVHNIHVGWGWVHAVTFSPDGKTLAVGNAADVVTLWEPYTAKRLGMLAGHTGQVFGLAFSRAGTRLVSGATDQTMKVWDLASRKEVLHVRHNDDVHSAVFTPDGQTVISAAGDAVRLWRMPHAPDRPIAAGHGQASVFAMALSP